MALESSLPTAHAMRGQRLGRPFRVAAKWQLGSVAVVAAVAALVSGGQAVVSAALGGLIGVAGLLTFAWVSSRKAATVGGAVRTALRAEAAKIIVIVMLLWLSFAVYRAMVVPAFIGAFAVSVFLSSLAFAVPDK